MSQWHLISRFLPTAFFLLIMSQPLEAKAQAGCFGELFPVGALAGSGNCDGIRAGQAVALINNPAHVAWGNRWSAGGGYRQLYGLDVLQRVWGAGRYRRDSWGIGLTVSYFGQTDFYTETEAAICFGLRLRHNIAVAVDIRNMQLAYTPEMPRYTGWSSGVGIIYQPIKEILVTGAIGRAINSNFIPGYTLSRRYHLSLAFILPGEIQLGAGWKQSEGDRDLLGLGQRLGLAKNLYFLSAVYFDPARYALGAELILRGQKIFYTYLSHPNLGGTHYVEFEVGGK
jgi:hypothetical protein